MAKKSSYSLAADSLDTSRYVIAESESLRPGQETPSLLVFLHAKNLRDSGGADLNSFFSSAQGTVEEALEYAVKRVNEAVAGKGVQPFGSCIALAIDAATFVVAAGGNGSAYLVLHNKTLDVSPSSTHDTREKLFPALATGAHEGGVLAVSLSKLSAQERAALASYEKCSDREQTPLSLFDGIIIMPQRQFSFSEKWSSAKAKTKQYCTLAMRKETYRNALSQLIVHLRHPRASFFIAFARLGRTFSHYRGVVYAMPKKRRIYALVGIITLIVMVRMLLTTLGARNVEEIIAETITRESKISELIQQNKETQALSLIDDTISLIGHAPSRLTDTQRATLTNLQSRLVRTAAQLNKVSIILAPMPVVSMEKSFKESRSFDLSGLALARGKLYTVNRAEREVYELDGKERRIVVIKDFPEGAGMPVGVVSAVPGYVFIRTENPHGILTLNTLTRSFTFSLMTLPRADALPISFAAFNDRIYMLDARSRAIYRYELTPKGYNLWSPWTDDTSLDFSQATTFTIDGTIYVTFSDHDIVRLVQGKRQPFAIDSIRPPLERVTAIATKEDSPFLYLLDPPQRRVVVIAKENGTLIAQYTSPLFTDLRGLFPDEAAKKVYVLNGDTIYAVGPEDKSITDLK